MRLRRAVIFLAVFFTTAGFDYGSKEWARTLPEGVPQPVIEGVWDWQLAYNTGAAFSSFTGAHVLLSILAACALVYLGVLAARTRPEQQLRRIALAVIAGGAVGNLIDRVRDGAVTDFVRWRTCEARAWPIFNVADVAIVIGVALLAIDAVLESRRPTPA
jgi:signal peptidase II